MMKRFVKFMVKRYGWKTGKRYATLVFVVLTFVIVGVILSPALFFGEKYLTILMLAAFTIGAVLFCGAALYVMIYELVKGLNDE